MRKAIATVLVGLLLVVMAALPASAASGCPLSAGIFGLSSSGSCANGSCLTGLLKNGCSIVQGNTGATGSCNIAKNCGITRLFDLLAKPCGR